MPIVHIDLDVARVCTTRRNEDASGSAADLGRSGSSRAVREADIEEARGWLSACCGSPATEELNIQACDSTSVRICGSIVRDRLNDSRRVHVNCEECEAEVSVLRINRVHVIDCGDKRRHVDPIEIQAPNAMEAAFDACNRVDAKFGRGLDVPPGNHGNVLVEGPKVDYWLDQSDALVQWSHINEVGEEVSLGATLAGSKWEWGDN